jgi:hypothetical protein
MFLIVVILTLVYILLYRNGTENYDNSISFTQILYSMFKHAILNATDKLFCQPDCDERTAQCQSRMDGSWTVPGEPDCLYCPTIDNKISTKIDSSTCKFDTATNSICQVVSGDERAFADNDKCYSCHSDMNYVPSLKKCIGSCNHIQNDTCMSCPQGTTLNNNSKCQSDVCTVHVGDKCLNCPDGYSYDDGNGTCTVKGVCPDGYVRDNKVDINDSQACYLPINSTEDCQKLFGSDYSYINDSSMTPHCRKCIDKECSIDKMYIQNSKCRPGWTPGNNGQCYACQPNWTFDTSTLKCTNKSLSTNPSAQESEFVQSLTFIPIEDGKQKYTHALKLPNTVQPTQVADQNPTTTPLTVEPKLLSNNLNIKPWKIT